MASIIWKSIYPLTNEAANHLAEGGLIRICTRPHDELMDPELPAFHPVAPDPSPLTILEMIKRAHEAVGANEEVISQENLERYFKP